MPEMHLSMCISHKTLGKMTNKFLKGHCSPPERITMALRERDERFPAMSFQILFLLILLALSSCTAQRGERQDDLTDYESVDMARCYDALREADTDGNGVIDAEEHLAFLQTFGSSDYWEQIQERPLELRAKFNALACMCMQRGSPPSCCHGTNAGIDITGLLEDNRQEQEYLETVCILTQRAIDEVERQRIEEIETDQATSVWLRTAFQVALAPGNTQSEEEILQDLGEAMNVLVEDVIEEETTTRRRRLQDVEYLPTRIEWRQAECNITIPAQNTCYDVDTFTYVVGPQNELDEAALESALVDAVASGKLQDELDIINPDSSLRVLDEETVPVVTEGPAPAPAPPPSDAEEDPNDTGHDWSVGAITGLALAGAGVLGLAAGLSYKRNQEVKKQKELQEQMQASLQGSKINMELRDTSLEHDLDDLEKGNGGGGILLEDSMQDSQRRVSYKMDQVGMAPFANDSLPPPPPDDPTLVVLPFVSNNRLSSREPSSGDMQASNNIHLDSLNSSNAFALTSDRYKNASSGSVGAMTPVDYTSAMGLDSKTSNNDDSSYASSSSSSSIDSDYTEGDTDSQESSSSSGSSEYDQHGIMKAHVYEARLAEARSSMQERALAENVPVGDAPPTSEGADTATIGVAGTVALGGAALFAATRVGEEEREADKASVQDIDPSINNSTTSQVQSDVRAVTAAGSAVLETETEGEVANDGAAHDTTPEPSEPTMSRSIPENSMVVPTTAGAPSAGLIAGVTAGITGAVALGGAALYAVTRDNKDDDGGTNDKSVPETSSCEGPPPQMQSEDVALKVDSPHVEGMTSSACISDPVAVGEESHYQLGSDDEEAFSGTASSPELAITIGEESQAIDDPVAVGEDESQLIEGESSTASAYSSGDFLRPGATSLSMLHESEGGDSTLESTLEESGSSFTNQSRNTVDQVEDSTILCPPPRPPSPTDEGPSPATAALIWTGVVGVGVGATAACVATRDNDSDNGSNSGSSTTSSSDDSSDDSSNEYSDDSSDSSSDSDSSETSTSESHAETNVDSQGLLPSVPEGNEEPVAVERARPPSSGSDHPYYAAAAVSTAVATGAVYDFSESGYSTNSHDESTNIDEPDSVYEDSAGVDEANMDSVPEEGVLDDDDGARGGGNVEPSAGSKAVTNSQPEESAVATNVGPVAGPQAAGAAIAAGVVGAGTLVAAASLAKGSESPQSDGLETDGSSSKGTEGYVEIPASSVVGFDDDYSDSDSSSETDSDESYDSSTGDITGMATTGKQSGIRSTADETQSLSTNAGLASSSNRTVSSDAAVVQGPNDVTDPTAETDDTSNASNVGVVGNAKEGALNDTGGSSTPQGLSTTTSANLSAGIAEIAPSTAAMAVEEPRSTLESAGSSTHAVVMAPGLPVDNSENHSIDAVVGEARYLDTTQSVAAESTHSNAATGHDVGVPGESGHTGSVPKVERSEGASSTGAVVAGVVAGGAALLGAAAVYAIGGRSSTDEETDNDQKALQETTADASDDVHRSVATEASVANDSTLAVSQATSPLKPGTQEDTDISTRAVISGTTVGIAVASEAAESALENSGSTNDVSQRSSDDERTTDEESSGDEESADNFTDVAVRGGRSLSRSTLGTSQAGTQSISRSTLETSASTLQGSYQGHDGSTSGFYAKESNYSLAKDGTTESFDDVAAVSTTAGKMAIAESIDSVASSSSSSSVSSDSSSSYDSDSTDGYYSSDSNQTSTEDASDKQGSRGVLDASSVASETSSAADETPQVQSALAMSSVDDTPARSTEHTDEDEAVTDVAAQENSGLNTAEMSESLTATLTESGDTFLAMEEAAFAYADSRDVAVTKTRFDQGSNEPAQQEKPTSATLVSAVGIGAVAAQSSQDQDNAESESESSEYTDTSSDDSSDSSSLGSTSSESSTDDSSSTASSDNETEASTSPPTAEDKTATSAMPSVTEEGAEKADLRSELRQVKSEGLISRKRDTTVGPAGPGARAQLLRARSDAMIAGSKQDETLQSLLTSWDQEYDITTGEEETTTSSEESLLVLYANAGLPPIVEATSDGSSQSLSLGTSVPLSEDAITEALKSGPLPEDAIAAAMQHGSSSLLNFDYSLRTVAEEQSGDMSGVTVDSSSTIGSGERAASIDQAFEKEVLQGLDTITELVEAPTDGGSKTNEAAASSGNISRESREQNAMSDEDIRSDGSSSSSSTDSSSEYTTDSSSVSSDESDSTSSSSDSSDSDGSVSTSYQSASTYDASTGSSSSSASPIPSSPDVDANKAFDSATAVDVEKDQTASRSSAGHNVLTSSVTTERDMLADSATWAAIAGANNSNLSEGGEDAAEWAVKRSLSALKVAEERAGTLGSSGSSFSSSEVSFSSDYTSSSDEER